MSIFYSVQKGRNRGVYRNYQDCKLQIIGHYKPIYKKFNNYKDAHIFAFPELYPMTKINEEQKTWIKSDKQVGHEFEIQCEKMIDYLNSDKMTIIVPKHKLLQNKIKIWIYGNLKQKIGIYFENNIFKTYTGYYFEKPPINKTRLRLSCCIEAL